MGNFENDENYSILTKDILENEKFYKIKNIEHHGIDKLTHSMRVSYYAYRIAKVLGLDYQAVARAGLLHDFALNKKGRNFKEKFIDTFTHPKQAEKNASELFFLSDMEKNIIKSHMFPFYTTLPRYAESWLVVLTDKTIGALEFCNKFWNYAVYATNFYILVLFNVVK